MRMEIPTAALSRVPESFAIIIYDLSIPNSMTWPEFLLMTLFNAAACILLPRLVALNWAEWLGRFAAAEDPADPDSTAESSRP